MSVSEIEACLTTVRDRPLPKDALSFFQYKQDARVFLTVTDQTSVWREDLIIGERLFGETVVCTTGVAETELDSALAETRDVLKQRMKYPNVKENPQLEQIAKTWILPTKLHKGPSVSQLLHPKAESIKTALAPFFTEIKAEQPVLHYLKIALESGATRQLLYKFLDDGFRPSLLCVKWEHDLDDHISTAHSVGHLLNVGYSQIYQNDATGYALYTFSDQPLYDICSVKGISLTNPFLNSLLQSLPISSVQRPTQNASAQEIVADSANTDADGASSTPTATDVSN
jgi:hypothetical protein